MFQYNLNQIDKIISQKKRIYERYKKNLSNIKGLNIPKIRDYTTKYIMWVFNVYLDNNFKISRDKLVKSLKDSNIDTRDAFVPINRQKILQKDYDINDDDCPNANYIMEMVFIYLLEIQLQTKRLIMFVMK